MSKLTLQCYLLLYRAYILAFLMPPRTHLQKKWQVQGHPMCVLLVQPTADNPKDGTQCHLVGLQFVCRWGARAMGQKFVW